MEHLRESELAAQWQAVETAATLEAMMAAGWETLGLQAYARTSVLLEEMVCLLAVFVSFQLVTHLQALAQMPVVSESAPIA